MSADMQQPTSEQMLAAENNTITTDTNTPGVADHKAAAQIDASKGYTPVFSETIRTVIYVVGLAAVLAGGGVALAGHADIGEYIIFAACSPAVSASPTTLYAWPANNLAGQRHRVQADAQPAIRHRHVDLRGLHAAMSQQLRD